MIKEYLERKKFLNQKLFENVYLYLSNEAKASLENGSSYGR